MNNLEQKLINDLSQACDIPIQINEVINTTLYNNIYVKKFTIYKIIKTSAAFLIVSLLFTSVAFAGLFTYQNFLKPPKVYNSFEESYKDIPQYIDSEKNEHFISEEDANKIALNILEQLGFSDQIIKKTELKQGYDSEYNCYYVIKTKENYEEGLEVDINASNGKFNFFINRDFKFNNYTLDNITEYDAQTIAQNIYSNLDFITPYEFNKIELQSEYFQSKIINKWQAFFYKKYDDVCNPYESLGINFISSNGDIIIESLGIQEDYTFKNNPIQLSKEKAIEIAILENKKYNTNDVLKIDTHLAVKKVNSFLYTLQNPNFIYKAEDLSRKVWVVHFSFYKDEIVNFNNLQQYQDREYYVDVTTGEIIGGAFVI